MEVKPGQEKKTIRNVRKLIIYGVTEGCWIILRKGILEPITTEDEDTVNTIIKGEVKLPNQR